ncbi:MAG: hypothetical protein ACRDOO_12175 [Actinomadura sp.]
MTQIRRVLGTLALSSALFITASAGAQAATHGPAASGGHGGQDTRLLELPAKVTACKTTECIRTVVANGVFEPGWDHGEGKGKAGGGGKGKGKGKGKAGGGSKGKGKGGA